MMKAQIIVLILIIGMVSVYFYTSTTSTDIMSISVEKSPTVMYKIIHMNDREPFYKLATLNGHKPYADGDRAQATVVKHLQLVDKCRKDPTLIVIDVGAYVGNYHKLKRTINLFVY